MDGPAESPEVEREEHFDSVHPNEVHPNEVHPSDESITTRGACGEGVGDEDCP